MHNSSIKSQKNIASLMDQFVSQNKNQLPAMMKFVSDVREEFKEIQEKHGTISAVLSTYQAIDNLITDAFAKSAQPISCTNCTAAHCCHQTVDICEAEATVIAQYCSENNIGIPKKYLKKQLKHNPDNIAGASCSACVFLKNNRCSIYPVRPSSCRTHHAVSQKEFCDISKYPGQKVVFLSNTTAELFKTAMSLEGGKSERMPQLLLKYSK